MKSVLFILLLTFSSITATAEGGHGLTEPGDYYNPDIKCSIADGVALYASTGYSLKISITAFDKKFGKVLTRYLAFNFAYKNSNSEVYQLEQLPEASHVAFFEIGLHQSRILNAQGAVVVNCQGSAPRPNPN